MSSLLIGDVRQVLPTLESESVQMCVTSPPYWGLRDYGVGGQLGLEATPEEYVDRMVDVFRGVRRVLKRDGTLWLNLGDSYARDAKKGQHKPGDTGKQVYIYDNEGGRASAYLRLSETQGSSDGKVGRADKAAKRNNGNGLKPKDLIGIPWRVAFALQADGWYLRQDIIWHKPNPMPESVTDRCTKAHEYVFLLSKSERYYFDGEAIKEESLMDDMRRPYGPGQVDNRGNGHDRGGGQLRKSKGNNKTFRGGGAYTNNQSFDNSSKAKRQSHGNTENVSGKRNKRSVWTIATQPYADAHFATFPPALVEPCIAAGSKSGDIVLDPFFGSGTTGEVCEKLGRQWLGIEINPEYGDMARRRTAQQGLALC